MNYQCLDCTYKGNLFPGGKCPGCGSPNIKRIEKPGEPAAPKTRKSYRASLAWVLWVYLLYQALKIAGIL
jgi:hypothetical protein